MRRMLYIFPWILLGTTLVFYILAFFAPVSRVDDSGLSLFTLRNIYADIEKVHPSHLTPQLLKVVQQRVECYRATPTARLYGYCHSNYLEDIVSIGRAEIHSAPQLGKFLTSVKFCPIVYSICMGEEKTGQGCQSGLQGVVECNVDDYDGDDNICNGMESRCIDAIFDRYWRGAPTQISGF